MENRTHATDAIIDAYEAKYGDTIRNASAWRAALLRKLALKSDTEISELHASLCGDGSGMAKKKDTPTAKDYAFSRLDRAVSDAAMLVARGWTAHDIEVVLTQDHGAELAGRAYAIVDDGSYGIAYPRYAPGPPTETGRISLGTYLAR